MYAEPIVENKNYVTITLPAVQTAIVQPSRSFKRKWNQLPRLQRVLLGMLTIIVVILILVILAQQQNVGTTERTLTLYLDNSKDHEDSNSRAPALGKLSADKVDVDFPDDNYGKERNEKVNEIQKQIPAPNQRTARQEAVVQAMKHAWKGYKTYAWGFDHLLPVSKYRNNWLNLGLTLIDALDTLWIMDLKEEFTEARNWIETQLNFDQNKDVNLFETTIRVLGGLLSAYHLTNDKMFLDKSINLGDRLLGAFESQSGVPFSDVNLATGKPSKPKWGPDSSTSEVTTIQLEFRDLSRITGNNKYAEKANFVSDHIHKLKKFDGLVPIFINAQTGQFRPQSTITLGARGDSYYEYLLKQWIQFGKKENHLRDDYVEAVSGMELHLGRYTFPDRLYFFGELHGTSRTFINKMDELTCYLPGTLALGVHNGMPAYHLDIAKRLLYTCVQTWLRQPTNLASEITYFNVAPSSLEDFFVKNNDAHYLLRPETIESLWYLYHLTGNTTYQDWGWLMFQGIEKYCRVDDGYTSIGNVKNPESTKRMDKMESFFLGETLKYLFLLFADDQRIYSLDNYVFNTEAHLLPIYKN